MSTPEENTLTSLLEEPVVTTLLIEKRETVKAQLYAHINTKKGKISSISPVKSTSEGIETIEIEYDLGIKFLKGTENITRWIAVRDQNDKFVIMKRDDARRHMVHRVRDLPLYELKKDLHDPDVRVEIGDSDVVRIHYRGDSIGSWKPSKLYLYFTDEGDPTHLKGVLALDVNTLNEIQALNHLPEWPNPIELPLQRADDVSVFTIKSALRVAISRHEASSN